MEWLKKLNKHFNLAEEDDAWIWFDYLSVPQNHRRDQVLAIASLCAYASLASRFIPLVRNAKEWERIYRQKLQSEGANPVCVEELDEDDEEEDESLFWSMQETIPGTLQRYLKRAWCRLELLAALCPKRSAAIEQKVRFCA